MRGQRQDCGRRLAKDKLVSWVRDGRDPLSRTCAEDWEHRGKHRAEEVVSR